MLAKVLLFYVIATDPELVEGERGNLMFVGSLRLLRRPSTLDLDTAFVLLDPPLRKPRNDSCY